jgi:hypothetical protein
MMSRPPRIGRLTSLIAGALAVLLVRSPAVRAGQLSLLDLENRRVDPLVSVSGVRATVLVFVSTDCPVSNRYAPEVRRLSESLASKGVAFWLVYPNASESPQQIREHLTSFSFPMQALRDPEHALAKRVHATVTPEAVVVAGGRILYRGRIDDRYVGLGVERPAPAKRDLEEALTAVIAGKRVEHPTTQAVGCFIADLLQ